MKRLALFLAILIPLFSFSQIINIPDDYPTIQLGIDAASIGDTVLVAKGIYYENITFKGKAITVASYYLVDKNKSHIDSTVIDGSRNVNPDSSYVVYFVNNEDTTSVLAGFTLKYSIRKLSSSGEMLGGGYLLQNAIPKMEQNKIIGQVLVRQEPKTYLSWIYLDNPIIKIRGSLYGVNDSSVSFIQGATLKQNSYVAFEPTNIYYHQINSIKIRKQSSIKTGALVGVITGVLSGIVVGSILGRNDSQYKKINTTTNFANAVAYGAAIGAIGAGIGIGIGSIKKSFQIKQNKVKFDHLREKMKRYTVKYE